MLSAARAVGKSARSGAVTSNAVAALADDRLLGPGDFSSRQRRAFAKAGQP